MSNYEIHLCLSKNNEGANKCQNENAEFGSLHCDILTQSNNMECPGLKFPQNSSIPCMVSPQASLVSFKGAKLY
jgi:hypothetical protein